ncbi:uncharacterized protein LOC115575638 [Sparus aurata]|uniref:uncharacterized protein LOC115575638 n=1 Tax=Sparus aurata TaxID=8175 RepID=UPI0011C101F8|nr:uncharacterized protein LOC115575638 [Sparus aurata]
MVARVRLVCLQQELKLTLRIREVEVRNRELEVEAMHLRLKALEMEQGAAVAASPSATQSPSQSPQDSFDVSSEEQQALCRYNTETLTYIDTVRGFCEGFSTWIDAREEELIQMRGIKGRAEKTDLSFSHVTQPASNCETMCEYVKTLPDCMKALWEYFKNSLTQEITKRRLADLETELTTVLKGTLGGLKELDHFLDAVEKLAVTSLHVFMEENQVLHLPGVISLQHVQAVIIAAQQICPLLLEFKRDASDFFLPKLQNVEVLSDQLYKYIKNTRKICEKLEKRYLCLTVICRQWS